MIEKVVRDVCCKVGLIGYIFNFGYGVFVGMFEELVKYFFDVFKTITY